MRFFKYLILIFVSLFPVVSFASVIYACDASTECKKQAGPSAYVYRNGDYEGAPLFSCIGGNAPPNFFIVNKCPPEPECWHPDYKIVTQPITSLKKTMCLPINGAVCKYVGDPVGAPILDGYITTTFSSVSKTPDPSCKEELVNPPCDPKDPYGGCFTPPDDGCTRQFNGSIECPADTVPKVQKGCANGATYCDRPPQGCGEGYVSGSYNGKQICIKTSPSTGTGGDGSGTGGDGSGTGGDGSGTGGDGSSNNTGTGTGSSTSTNTTTNSDGSTTTTTNTTVNNFSIDFSPVVNAINKVSDKLTSFKNELLTSISDLSNQIGLTNNKIDSTNSKLTEINDSSLRQEDLLKAIRDKESPTGGNGSPSDQPASGASVDLTETNGLLTEIRDGIDSIKDVFSDEGKAELEQIGQASNDSRYLNAQGNAQSSLNNLANKLTFGSSACLSDFQIQLPIFGPVNIALSQWCSLLALLKILLNLIVLLTCLRMLDATVRTI